MVYFIRRDLRAVLFVSMWRAQNNEHWQAKSNCPYNNRSNGNRPILANIELFLGWTSHFSVKEMIVAFKRSEIEEVVEAAQELEHVTKIIKELSRCAHSLLEAEVASSRLVFCCLVCTVWYVKWWISEKIECEVRGTPFVQVLIHPKYCDLFDELHSFINVGSSHLLNWSVLLNVQATVGDLLHQPNWVWGLYLGVDEKLESLAQLSEENIHKVAGFCEALEPLEKLFL